MTLVYLKLVPVKNDKTEATTGPAIDSTESSVYAELTGVNEESD